LDNIIKEDKNYVYQNIFFAGGNNIVLIIKIGEIEYALRISINSYTKENCNKFINEIKMMHKLNDLGIGVIIR